VSRGLLVTGTDTGVGKTLVGASLALALRRRGFTVGALKAAESGCTEVDGELYAEDAVFWKKSLELTEPLEKICPYRLVSPLAPAVAAMLEGITIDPKKITRAFRHLADRYDLVFLEGAGGLLVPLAGDLLIADLASGLSLPVLVVVASRLGAVNHTLLTLECLKARGLACAGVVVNCIGDPDDPATEGNVEVIESLVEVPILGVLPRFDPDESCDTVASWMDEWFDLDGLIAFLT